jgi:signal transduction histidine kinase
VEGLIEETRGLGAPGSSGEVVAGVLPGLARWAVDRAGDALDAAAVVGGLANPPVGAIAVEGDGAVVVLACRDTALVAVADGPRAVWAEGAAAVRAALGHLALPPGAGARVEQAVARAPEAGGRDAGPVLAALDAAVSAERAALAATIHDRPVQELTAAQLLIDSALWGDDVPGSVREPLEQGLEALRQAITSCRGIMAELQGRRPGPGA